jgi:succinate dehydrogenase / fumarate reductase flavoprotein subunit
MARFVQGGAPLLPVAGDPLQRAQKRLRRYMDEPERGNGSRGATERVAPIAAALKETMTRNVGVFRNEPRMAQALQEIRALQERYRNARIMDTGKRFNTDLLAALETENLLTFSEVIVAGGLARQESRGAHYRTDFPSRDDEQWLQHTLAHKDGDGRPQLSYKPVTIFWDRYPPQERKY